MANALCMHVSLRSTPALPKPPGKCGEWVKTETFGSLLIDENSIMWNAGVIALPAGSSHYLQTALEACDAMCRSEMRVQFTEQFALSLALAQTKKLYEAKEWFLHYWNNKPEWEQNIIAPFLQKAQQHSLPEALHLIQRINPDLVPIQQKRKYSKILTRLCKTFKSGRS